jgi:hypothetical protein
MLARLVFNIHNVETVAPSVVSFFCEYMTFYPVGIVTSLR